MIRNSYVALSKKGGLKSHQLTSAGYPFNANRFAHYYGRNQLRFGNGGFGQSTYSVRKKHVPKIRQMPKDSPKGVSTVLSGHWRSYALADGGVLFTHPNHKQLMAWSQQVEEKEAAAAGITAVSENAKAKIQSIIVDNTLENYALSSWRRRHLWQLVKAKSMVSGPSPTRATAVDSLYTAMRSHTRLNKSVTTPRMD